jgi:hypothetical protein
VPSVLTFACIGHWYTDLLYLVPVGLMAGLVGRDKFRHRKRRRARTGSARRPARGRATSSS